MKTRGQCRAGWGLWVATGWRAGLAPFWALLLVPLLLAGTVPVLSAPAARPVAEELFVGNRGDINTLEPGNLQNINNYPIADNIYNFLIRYEPGTSNLKPDLATRWEVSRDGLTYTFFLRRGVKFHKGYGEFTAEDVKCQFERIVAPENNSIWRARWLLIEKIEVVDTYTVRFTLNAPFAPFLAYLAGFRGGPIASCKATKEFGRNYGQNPIGTGPFVFERWVPRSEVILVRNEEYWGTLPSVKRVRFIPIADDTVAAAALEKGEISMRYFRDPEVIARLEKNPNLVVERKPMAGVWGLYYRTDRPPYNDVRVRRAIAHAVNRRQIVNFILRGVSVEAVTFLSPTVEGSTTDVPTYPVDRQKAKRLLVEAGHPTGFEADFLTTQLPPWPLVNPVIQDNLRAVGIRVRMRQLEQAVYREESVKGSYDLTVQGVVDSPDPDAWAFLFHTANIGAGNFSHYKGIDALIDRARTTIDPARRKTMYIELQKKVAEEAAFVPLFHLGAQLVRWKKVGGVPVAVQNDFPLHTVYVER